MESYREAMKYLVPASIFISAALLYTIACAIESVGNTVVKKARNDFMHAVEEFFDRG